jgi:DNA (cytosine-5)-methyltransferase 1
MITSQVKVGDNRGRRRVWLEGKRLIGFGFHHQAAYTVTYADGIVIARVAEGTADSRKVAGSEKRPILDICSNKVGVALGGADRADVLYEDGFITITAAKEASA